MRRDHQKSPREITFGTEKCEEVHHRFAEEPVKVPKNIWSPAVIEGIPEPRENYKQHQPLLTDLIHSSLPVLEKSETAKE